MLSCEGLASGGTKEEGYASRTVGSIDPWKDKLKASA
jgi:hypothetical protein